MPKQITLDEAYRLCVETGTLQDREIIDRSRIKTILITAESNLDFAKQNMGSLPKESNQQNAIYLLHYIAAQELADALSRFGKIKALNHRALFAYACKNHSELDWDFFEKIRTKRNSSLYYGEPLSFSDWKEVEIGFKLHINAMKEIIVSKLGN